MRKVRFLSILAVNMSYINNLGKVYPKESRSAKKSMKVLTYI